MNIFIFLTVLFSNTLFQSPSINDEKCNIVVFSELEIDINDVNISYHTDCQLEFIIIEIYDNSGKNIYNIDKHGLEWGDKKLLLKKTNQKENMNNSSNSFYYVTKYKFIGNDKTYKDSGTISSITL